MRCGRRLHRRIAEAIEALQTDRLADFWEALADHWERGEAWTRAVHYHVRVAERAKQRFAYATAEVACRQAVEAAAKCTDASIERTLALELLGDVRSLRGDLDHANESSAAALARRIPDARLYLFEGRGHLPIFTATAEFCDVLRRFIASTPSGPAT